MNRVPIRRKYVCDGDCQTVEEHEEWNLFNRMANRRRSEAARRLPPLDGRSGFDDLWGRDPLMNGRDPNSDWYAA